MKQNEKYIKENKKTINDIIKENNNRMEIAKEFSSNNHLKDILADKLANKRNFPPC